MGPKTRDPASQSYSHRFTRPSSLAIGLAFEVQLCLVGSKDGWWETALELVSPNGLTM